MLRVCLYGLLDGMNLLLSGNTLNFWLASHDVDYKIIGFFSCITLPLAFKYFIALFVNKYHSPILKNNMDRHRAWLIFAQTMMAAILVIMSFLNPKDNLWLIGILGFFLCLFSVIQYIIFNGSRINILKKEEQGSGSALYNVGFRVGLFITGAGVIFISSYINWSNIYIFLAVLYTCLIFIIYYVYKETILPVDSINQKDNKNILYNLLSVPLEKFSGYKNMIWIILLVLFYQMADSILMAMLNPFLLYKGYNAFEIASASKTTGIIMVIIGGIVSGPLVDKIGIKRSLISFGAIHACGHALFIILSIIEKNISYLYFITGYVAFTGGMATTAYLSFISILSNGKHATILYAFLSSLLGAAWVLFPMTSGIIAQYYGWTGFFIIITIISCSSLMLTWNIPARIYNLYEERNKT